MLLMFAFLSFIPVVNAEPGKWPAYLFKKPGYFGFSGGNWIGAWFWSPPDGPGIEGDWEIPHDQYSFFRTGWMVADYEIEMGYDPGPPYQYNLFINGEKIGMKRWVWTEKGERIFPDGEFRPYKARAWMWVVRFDPYFFEQGKDYEIRLQFLVKNPYYGSPSNKWRTYINHLEDITLDTFFEYWYGEAGLINDQHHTLHVY